ncbi:MULTISPECIES: LysR family transcriptional regulator [Azorhizobium]|uniref:LysR family transcriptional regulator n=1 Tax=Azorhizobium TaxID=6 RepID=UPI001060A180|nr:LysR family transcriptional regulator [Azorhizobium sp. AG788]TDT93574.1 LysR family transcriptional regulator [Azorhizobium sp. AG788]
MSRLDDVEVFLRVVDRGSFNGAAEQLGLPPTSVSRKVKALEDRLGVQLLHRTTRRVWPSEAGQAYYQKCVDAIAALDHADASIRALTQEPEGHLKVLLPHSTGILIVEPELANFRRRYPKVQLHITLDNHPLDLIEHGFDVAVRLGPVRDSSYHVRNLGSQQLIFLASPDYLDEFGRPSHPRELADHDIIAVRTSPGPLVWQLDGPNDSFEMRVSPALDTNDAIMAVRQASGACGITMLSRCMSRRRVESGELEVVLPGWQRRDPVEQVAIFPARATLDLKVRVFVDFLVDAYNRWQGEGPTRDADCARLPATPAKAKTGA